MQGYSGRLWTVGRSGLHPWMAFRQLSFSSGTGSGPCLSTRCTVLWPARSSASITALGRRVSRRDHWDLALHLDHHRHRRTGLLSRGADALSRPSVRDDSWRPSSLRKRTGTGRGTAALIRRRLLIMSDLDAPVRARHGHDRGGSGGGGARHAKTVVVVPIARAAPVARAGTLVLRVVVRRTAAQYPTAGGRSGPRDRPSAGAAAAGRGAPPCATQALTRCSTSLRVTVPARQRSRSPRRRLRNRRTLASGNPPAAPAAARIRETSPATPWKPRASLPDATTAGGAPGTPPRGRASR